MIANIRYRVGDKNGGYVGAAAKSIFFYYFSSSENLHGEGRLYPFHLFQFLLQVFAVACLDDGHSFVDLNRFCHSIK